jgi:Skp family chaperone for outer membrane proteins
MQSNRMRGLCRAAAAFAVFVSLAAPAAAGPVAPVYLLDTDAIWARYVTHGLSKESAEARKADLTKAMQPVLAQLTKEGAIVLDKSAVLESSGGEIAPLVIGELDKHYSSADGSAAPPATKPKPLSPRMVILSKDTLTQQMQSQHIAGGDALISQIIDQLAKANGSALVLERESVVLGAIDLDVTPDGIFHLKGGRGVVPHPVASRPVHILYLNRDDLLKFSKVGKSLNAQVEAETDDARAEFQRRSDLLQQYSEGLDGRLAGLDPQEAQRQVDALNAKRATFNDEVKARERQLDTAVDNARMKIEATLGPLLQIILTQRHCELLLDSKVVLAAPPGFDLTNEATAKLDTEMFAVDLGMPPLSHSSAAP